MTRANESFRLLLKAAQKRNTAWITEKSKALGTRDLLSGGGGMVAFRINLLCLLTIPLSFPSFYLDPVHFPRSLAVLPTCLSLRYSTFNLGFSVHVLMRARSS
jgi:hypothetical protein